MPGVDPDHWLYRLTPESWLAAADTELEQCAASLQRRAFRPAVTYARRAAGMAINAMLVLREDPELGRSYMDHVKALAERESPVQAAARLLRDTPPAPPELVSLGRPDLRVLEAARAIVTHCRETVAQLSR